MSYRGHSKGCNFYLTVNAALQCQQLPIGRLNAESAVGISFCPVILMLISRLSCERNIAINDFLNTFICSFIGRIQPQDCTVVTIGIIVFRRQQPITIQ